MNGALQARINPPSPRTTATISADTVKSANDEVSDSSGAKKTEFRTLMANSNSEAIRERLAKGPENLANAKNDQEFFERLNKQTEAKHQRTPSSKMGKDEFLKLFITQIQNQDPLSPKDSSDMAAQLAQFNGLEQMLNVNKNLEKMSASQDSSRTVGLIDYVGKEITVTGGKLKLTGGKYSDATFNLKTDVPSAMLEVRNEAGAVVSTQELGNVPKGEHPVQWGAKDKDGARVADGLYTLSIVAKDMNDIAVPVDITSRVKVTGVDMQQNGNFYTEVGRVNLSDVHSVGTVGFSKAAKVEAMKNYQQNDKEPQNIPVKQPPVAKEANAPVKTPVPAELAKIIPPGAMPNMPAAPLQALSGQSPKPAAAPKAAEKPAPKPAAAAAAAPTPSMPTGDERPSAT